MRVIRNGALINGKYCRVAIVLFSFALVVFFYVQAWAAANTIIVVIKSRTIGPYMEAVESFKKSMAEYDYNVKVVEFELSGESISQEMSDNIRGAGPRLIFSLGTPATKAARQVFSEADLPVFYAMVLNPEASNIGPPGVSMDIPFDLKFKVLKKIMPQVKNIGVIYSSDYAYAFEAVRQSGANLGLNLIGRQISSQKEFSDALADMLKGVDCFLMIADPTTYMPKTTEYLLLEALQKKIPVIGLSSPYTKAGALLAFDCDYADLGKQAAELIFKTISGKSERLGEVMLPRKIKLSLNLKVAERLSIDIPQEIVSEAGEVFGR